tara:strand:+ start:1140 stop:1403 length:264 start_codon:yes stop_codon:yes gene_type:complete
MKLTKQRLKEIIKEELSAISETDDLESRLRSTTTEPLDYDMLSDEQQIELGNAANQMVEIFVRVPPELRSHLKDLVVLNLNKIGELQ